MTEPSVGQSLFYVLVAAKVGMVMFLIVLGAVFIAHGIGGTLPWVTFPGGSAADVPVGIIFIVAAISVLKVWTIKGPGGLEFRYLKLTR